jgi:glycosyltransferase involved in cell wall biosynthesis
MNALINHAKSQNAKKTDEKQTFSTKTRLVKCLTDCLNTETSTKMNAQIKNPIAVHVYTVAWNEEVILPFFLDHYARFATKITVFDQHSTDATAEILRHAATFYAPSVEVVHAPLGGSFGGSFSGSLGARLSPFAHSFSDRRNLALKQSCYKASRRAGSRDNNAADFVIVCDADEFYFHPEILSVLADYKASGVNVAQIEGYQMITQTFPTTFPITQAVKRGVRFPQLDKLGVFDPQCDLRWSVGFHKLLTTTGVQLSEQADIKLLHYKFLSKEYVQKRHQDLSARLGLWNKIRGWGRHYSVGDEVVSRWHDEHWLEATDVI